MFGVKDEKELPEQRREKLRQEELKNNSMGNFSDAVNRSQGGGLVDLINSLGWKGTGVTLFIIVTVFILYRLFFSG